MWLRPPTTGLWARGAHIPRPHVEARDATRATTRDARTTKTSRPRSCRARSARPQRRRRVGRRLDCTAVDVDMPVRSVSNEKLRQAPRDIVPDENRALTCFAARHEMETSRVRTSTSSSPAVAGAAHEKARNSVERKTARARRRFASAQRRWVCLVPRRRRRAGRRRSQRCDRSTGEGGDRCAVEPYRGRSSRPEHETLEPSTTCGAYAA